MNINKVLSINIIGIIMFSFACNYTYGQDLKKHIWKNRILIIKTLKETTKKYHDQINQFKNSEEALLERKCIMYIIEGDKYTSFDYGNNSKKHTGKISKETRNLFDQNKKFEVLLIGLDGKVKLQQPSVLLKETFFNKIDGMPMRYNEVLRKGR